MERRPKLEFHQNLLPKKVIRKKKISKIPNQKKKKKKKPNLILKKRKRKRKKKILFHQNLQDLTFIKKWENPIQLISILMMVKLSALNLNLFGKNQSQCLKQRSQLQLNQLKFNNLLVEAKLMKDLIVMEITWVNLSLQFNLMPSKNKLQSKCQCQHQYLLKLHLLALSAITLEPPKLKEAGTMVSYQMTVKENNWAVKVWGLLISMETKLQWKLMITTMKPDSCRQRAD